MSTERRYVDCGLHPDDTPATCGKPCALSPPKTVDEHYRDRFVMIQEHYLGRARAALSKAGGQPSCLREGE